MDPSLNSTPMDLLNPTEDFSPCNSTPMNRAHALGVSVGEARDRRAFARVGQCAARSGSPHDDKSSH